MYKYNIYLLNTLRKKREREREIQRKSFADCFFINLRLFLIEKYNPRILLKKDLPIIFS